MVSRHYTIGQISRLTGVSVRRLRFYADKGILPPSDRTEGGYRLFCDEDIVRIDLIQALRAAGLGLQAIGDLLAKKLSLRQILTLRLQEIEAQLNAQRRVASAIKTALSSTELTNDDLRRIWIMTNLSELDRSNAIQHFFEQVIANSELDPKWGQWMARMSTFQMPEEPTAEQLDAWLELAALLTDPVFVQQMRENGRDAFWPLNAEKFKMMQDGILLRASSALADGADPTDALGQSIADGYLSGWALATGVEADSAFFARMRRKYLQHQPLMRRYWTLVGTMGGLPDKSAPSPESVWIEAATRHRLKGWFVDKTVLAL
jgi:DNA-binding transcriptional MerR regulator